MVHFIDDEECLVTIEYSLIAALASVAIIGVLLALGANC
ncbi:MAG: Flp family type IVb pilin [Candidatus Binatia bacterium]